MLENTFIHKAVEHEGRKYDILTAQEYPWLNTQIIPFTPAERDNVVATLLAQPTIGWVIEHPTRRDFAVIHIGGCKHKLNVTQANYEQVCDDMKQCMRNAAAWWAEHSPETTQSVEL